MSAVIEKEKKRKNKKKKYKYKPNKYAQIQSADYVLDCNEVSEMKTTNNEWIVDDRKTTSFGWLISNKSYKMNITIDLEKEIVDGEQKIKSYNVSYTLITNTSVFKQPKTVAQVIKKKFPTAKKCIKYIEGRKKHFRRYFSELYQPIFEEDVDQFMSCGR